MKQFKLDGASQKANIGWGWISYGQGEVTIEHGDILTLCEYCYEKKFSHLRRILMRLMGFSYYYSGMIQRVVVIHSSIIDRYFTKIKYS